MVEAPGEPMRLAFALLGLPLLAAPPAFTVQDAIRAQWKRQAPTWSETEKARLSPGDRARLELTLQRIGAPGAPGLLPPELDKPTPETWEARARVAQTPQARFTALFFLNRLKSAKALFTLEGLGAKDAESWPGHLHLEAQIATARLNGGEVGPGLQGFLDALQKAGKIDPVRAQAAQLRLVMGGKEKELLPPVKATAGSVLAMMDAWNKAPWEMRKTVQGDAIWSFQHHNSLWAAIGVKHPTLDVLRAASPGVLQRLLDGLPDDKSIPGDKPGENKRSKTLWGNPLVLTALFDFCARIPYDSEAGEGIAILMEENRVTSPALFAHVLPALRKHDEREADGLRQRLLLGSDPIARAAAIDDMTEAPADLEALQARLWKTEEYDGVQVLLPSLEKWKLTEARRRAILARFYDHPCWTARLDAWRELSKLDPKAPWPKAPRPSATDEAILKEAEVLATAGRPVRLRLTFSGKRRITLRLDPLNAPMNVANLVLLARKGFFNGRLVPRVVPDFVVQMGSPCDTMDGGPGYTVRCENSLDWYGPGSVGMALSGKDTGGSQFFITTNAAPHLTGRYTRVGEVEDLDQGLRLLDDLELGARLEEVEVLEGATPS